MLRLVLAMLLLAAFGTPTFADTLPSAGEQHVRVSLLAESERPAPGATVALALVMEPRPGWHDYWSNPGDAGVPTRAAWTLPPALGPVSAFRYPVPDTYVVAGLMNHIYRAPHALLASVTVKPGTPAGTLLPIRGKIDWLACSESLCVPESGTVSTTLTVGDGTISADRRTAFDRWRAALPQPLEAGATVALKDGALRVAVPLPAAVKVDQPHLFAGEDGVVSYAAPQTFTHEGDTLVVTTAPASGLKAVGRFDALLKLSPGRGLSIHVEPGPVPAAGSGSGVGGQVLLALGAAILGGLILNVMPCVFPILSLKALGLARSGEDEAHARAEALAYAAGVVLVCLALGGILLALQAAGRAAGWAFQLQSPAVVLGLTVLMTAIAFNLAGLFELAPVSAGGGLAAKGGVAGAFWTGALAAFVATPCSGPFLGTAIGATAVLPAAAGLAIFAGLGLGLALPFLLVGFVPALRRRLPRPGAWMGTFRRILSVPMFLTALALAWVLGREAGANAMALALAAALLAALGLWWTGRRQESGRERAWVPGAIACVLALGAAVALPAGGHGTQSASTSNEAFSEARLAALQAQHRPIFVYFTADWCTTCKVNEALAIDRSQVTDAFARAHVETLVGDWTNGDPAITRFLAAHGRSSVPFYLFYPAKGGSPRVLPQVLTPGMLAALAG